MAISRISAQDNSGTGANPTATYPSATITNDLLIIGVKGPSAYATATGFTAIQETIDAGGGYLTLLYGLSSGQTTVAITSAGAGTQYAAYEYSGNATTSYLETSNASTNGTTSATTIVTGSITTANSGDLIFNVVGSSSTTLTISSFTHATVLPDAGTQVGCGQYSPGTTLSSFTDTANTTNKITSSITAAFKAQSASYTANFISFFQ